jgi:prepilin signal peptidase PulO-like enzyme (type II secretory pathway)
MRPKALITVIIVILGLVVASASDFLINVAANQVTIPLRIVLLAFVPIALVGATLVFVQRQTLGILSKGSSETASTLRLLRTDAKATSNVLASHDRLVTIGRSPTSMVKLADHDVSWEHGQIIFRGGEYLYVHLSNTNPTVVRRRGQEQMLRPGLHEEISLRNEDRLEIGNTTLIVEFDIVAEDTGYISTNREGDGSS